jgi:SAM-dependent methyltransferase
MPETSDDAPARQRAWASYWRSGALHSCASSFQGNYGGAIAAFWRGVFDGLRPGDRVLDLAAGNGALSQLLIEHRAETDIGCDAVDLAPIAPAWVAALPVSQRERLRFHGDTPAEALPFEAGRFALAVSQYGLEYTDLDASVAELLRVLRRPARAGLLVHHAASRPVGLAHDEIGHIDWLLAPDGLLDTGAAMLPLLARASTAEGRAALAQDAQALARRRRFNDLQQELARRAAGAPCPDVLYETREAVAALLDIAARRGAADAQARLPALREALAQSRVRLADLCRCALDEAAVHALAQRFAALGAARIEPLHEAGWLMGWTLRIG